MNDRIGKLKEIGLYGDYSEEELPNNIIDLIYNKEAVYNESSEESYNDLDDDDYVYDIITMACMLTEYWYIFGN